MIENIRFCLQLEQWPYSLIVAMDGFMEYIHFLSYQKKPKKKHEGVVAGIS